MSIRPSFKSRKMHDHFQEEFPFNNMEKSSHSSSKYRQNMTQSMTKSFYSQFCTDRKPQAFHQTTNTFTSSHKLTGSDFTETLSQVGIKKHQNKKFNKLLSLIAYTLASANKALNFLDVSCNFEADFAHKLYISDRQNLLKELNVFSLQTLIPQKTQPSINNLQVKSMIIQQSLLMQSNQLRQQNERLRKELVMLQLQIGKEQTQKYRIMQSKSSHNFYSSHEVNEYNALLITKNCQFDLLKEEYDFIQMEKTKISHLLLNLCKFNQVKQYLDSVRQETKWKIEALNIEHPLQKKNRFDQLAKECQKKSQKIAVSIVDEMNQVYEKAEKIESTQKELKRKYENCELVTSKYKSKCEESAQKQLQFQSKQQKYSDEICKLSRQVIRLQQKLTSIQSSISPLRCSFKHNQASVQQIIAHFIQTNTSNQQKLKLLNLQKEEQEYLQENISQLKKANQNYHQKVLQLNQVIQSKRDLVDSSMHNQLLSCKDQQIQSLQASIHKNHQEFNQIEQQRDSLKQNLQSLQKQFKNHLEKIMILQQQLSISKGRNTQMQILLQDMQKEIDLNKNKYQSTISNHNNKIRQYETNLTTLHSLHQSLQQILNDSRQKSSQTVKALQNLISHLKQENESLRREAEELKKMIENLKEETRSLLKQEKNHQAQIIQLIAEKGALEQQISRWKTQDSKRYTHFQTEIHEHRTKIEYLQKENIKINQEHDKQREKFKSILQQKETNQLQEKFALQRQNKQIKRLNQQNLIKLEEKNHEITELKISFESLKRKIDEVSLQKQAFQQTVISLQSLMQQQADQNDVVRHQYVSELARIKKQVEIYQQRCKSMEIDKIMTEKAVNEDQMQLKHKICLLQEKLKQSQLMLEQQKVIFNRKIQELLKSLSLKQHEIDEAITNFNYTNSQIKIQAQQIQYLQKKIKQEANAKINIGLNLQAPKQIELSNEQNHFTDFGSFIQQKMQQSFVSIIHSQRVRSEQDKVLEKSKPQEGSDEFEDFSSSQNGQIMYSMSSHNQSVQQKTIEPQEISHRNEPFMLLPSVYMFSTTCQVTQSKASSLEITKQHNLEAEDIGNKEQKRLKRTYSIINDEDPVVQSQPDLMSGEQKTSFVEIRDAQSVL